MAHGSQVIYLIRLYLLNNTDKISGIRQITMMQNKITIRNVWILI
jgi:hypothetical protein